MWQGRKAYAGACRRGLVLKIAGAEHDVPPRCNRLQPLLLRHVVHAGVIGDEGQSVRRGFLEIGRGAIKAEAEMTDLACDQPRFGRA